MVDYRYCYSCCCYYYYYLFLCSVFSCCVQVPSVFLSRRDTSLRSNLRRLAVVGTAVRYTVEECSPARTKFPINPNWCSVSSGREMFSWRNESDSVSCLHRRRSDFFSCCQDSGKQRGHRVILHHQTDAS